MLFGLMALCSVLLAACGGGERGATGQATASTTATPNMRIQAVLPGSVMVNEVVAGAWAGPKDEDGDAEDWLELYNSGDTATDLTGYGLSNKTSTPFQWVFPAGTTLPAKGYLVVWLSKKDRAVLGLPLHTNFNLDSGADGVFLSASNATATGVLVGSATPPLLRHDHSWCRMPSGSITAPFAVCEAATPGAANAGTNHPAILATPTLSLTGGFYATPQTLTVSGPAGATLRYTTDGSEPSATSPAYNGPLAIAASQAIRVAAFAPNAAPSLVATATYIIDAAMAAQYTGLKAMLVTIPPDDLAAFEADNKDRRFRASFEYITGGRTSVFRMDGEGVSGGQEGSATSPQRTMNVAGRDAFGPKSFPAVFWPDKPTIKSHRKFRLRNGSSDWGAAHLRDQLSQRISVDGPNLIASSATVAMFINGQYYALMDLREREEETLPATNLGIDKDWVEYLSDPLLPEQEIKNGGAAALASYQALHTLATTTDLSNPANYARVKALMTPESLAYDWALHMFHANYDWPRHNVHVWRSPEVDQRWTWRPHDMDFAFDSYTFPQYNMNSSFAEPGSELINALLKNTEFRNLYLNTVADQLNVMSPAYMEATLTAMAADMRPYIPDYTRKNPSLESPERWEGAIEALRFYFGQREPVYDAHTRSHFGLGLRQPISVGVNDPAMGSVSVNGVDTGKYMGAGRNTWQGSYYPGVPISLLARPKPGFAFVGWQGASTATTRQINRTLAAPASNTFPADNFSVRWRGAIEAPVSGATELQVAADDGVRLWFDNVLVVDSWSAQPASERNATVTLVAGRRHSIVVEYFDAGGAASVKLNWRLPNTPYFVNVLRERLYPAGAPAPAAATGTGLSADYFANATLAGTPAFSRTEYINVDWGSSAPAATAPAVVLTAVFQATGAPVAPSISALPAQSWRTGDVVRLVVSATDPGQYPLSYAATGLPKGLAINAKTGVVYGRLSTPGSASTTVTASNGVSSGSTTISWTVSDRPGSGLLGTSPGYEPPSPPPPPPPPNRPPTVALLAPVAGTSFALGSPISLSADAADADGGVARVEFYDGSTLIGSDALPPFSLVWNNASTGSHSITAKAIDIHGNSTSTAQVAISVATVAPPPPVNQAPTVRLSSPANSSSVALGTVLTVTAEASDADGSVARVEFYDGSTLLATRFAPPYSVSGAGAPGVHVLTAVAVDNRGASTRSAPVTVTIAGSQPAGSGTGLSGSYYANISLVGTPTLVRTEAVNFVWGAAAPDPKVPADNFSVRWRGSIEWPASGTYQLQTTSDDGVRVSVNGVQVINNWSPHGPTVDTSASVSGVAGQRVPMVVEFKEYTGGAQIQLRWKLPGSTVFVPVPIDRLYQP